MIPDLDEHGLLPPGIHDCTLQEIKERFCWTARRQEIFAGFTRFLGTEWVPLRLDCPLYVDGSFVRNKALPGDMDAVIELSEIEPVQAMATALALRYRHDEIKMAYNVDVWTRHPSLPLDLRQFFQYVGDKAAAELHLNMRHPKGILRVTP